MRTPGQLSSSLATSSTKAEGSGTGPSYGTLAPVPPDPSRHLAFIGFMGAGKSTMAELVAQRLGRPWFDTDHIIVDRCGRSIPELFAAGEEPRFRALEKQVIAELLAAPPAVLSLGGGALEDADTRSEVFERAFVVWLDVPWMQPLTHRSRVMSTPVPIAVKWPLFVPRVLNKPTRCAPLQMMATSDVLVFVRAVDDPAPPSPAVYALQGPAGELFTSVSRVTGLRKAGLVKAEPSKLWQTPPAQPLPRKVVS